MSDFRSGGHRPDVVIVGGGTAGAVLAARLSQDPKRSVVLLEAGPAYPSDWYPPQLAGSGVLGPPTGHDWGYVSEPGFVGHSIGTWRGKVLGGSSAVNGAVAVRALPSDFARWTERGLKGWSFDEVLPDYIALENTVAGSDEWHGRSGPLLVHQLGTEDLTELQQAFVTASVANGIPTTDDFNGPNPIGVGPYPMNVANGVRLNTGIAYLDHAVRARPNLRIHADVMVDRIQFQGSHATGVVLADGTVVEGAEIVLSAGTYGSAAILLRSGIGPAEDLRALDIPVLADLPVGRRLQDHPFFFNAYAIEPSQIANLRHPIAAMLWTASSLAGPDEFDIHIPATHIYDPRKTPTGAALNMAVAMVRPTSLGSVTLKGKDPNLAPRIDLNLLATPEDRARLLEGIKLSRRIAATAPLAGLVGTEIDPGPSATTDDEIEAAMIASIEIYHHPVSTAPMGAEGDPHSVVDWLGQVHGVHGLRVVDASIFPDIPSAMPLLTIVMMAERISRLAF